MRPNLQSLIPNHLMRSEVTMKKDDTVRIPVEGYPEYCVSDEDACIWAALSRTG